MNSANATTRRRITRSISGVSATATLATRTKIMPPTEATSLLTTATGSSSCSRYHPKKRPHASTVADKESEIKAENQEEPQHPHQRSNMAKTKRRRIYASSSERTTADGSTSKQQEVLSQLPSDYKKQFGQIGFVKWTNQYFPVLILSPFDVPPVGKNSVYDKWETMFQKCRTSNRLDRLNHLAFWYGSTDMNQAFAFVSSMNFISYQDGCEKGYDCIPEKIQQFMTKHHANPTKRRGLNYHNVVLYHGLQDIHQRFLETPTARRYCIATLLYKDYQKHLHPQKQDVNMVQQRPIPQSISPLQPKRKKLPSWMGGPTQKHSPTDHIRSFGYQYLNPIADFLKSNAIAVPKVILELEDALYMFTRNRYEQSKTAYVAATTTAAAEAAPPPPPLPETQATAVVDWWTKLYFELVHRLVKGVVGTFGRGGTPLSLLLKKGRFSSAMDVVEYVYRQLNEIAPP